MTLCLFRFFSVPPETLNDVASFYDARYVFYGLSQIDGWVDINQVTLIIHDFERALRIQQNMKRKALRKKDDEQCIEIDKNIVTIERK